MFLENFFSEVCYLQKIYKRKLSFTFHLVYLVFNFSIVAVNIELSIRETARHQADRAVCGHVGISELSLPIAQHAIRVIEL